MSFVVPHSLNYPIALTFRSLVAFIFTFPRAHRRLTTVPRVLLINLFCLFSINIVTLLLFSKVRTPLFLFEKKSVRSSHLLALRAKPGAINPPFSRFISEPD
ncbi:hypothetical protein V2J09_002636 [Rumex salicifolius]